MRALTRVELALIDMGCFNIWRQVAAHEQGDSHMSTKRHVLRTWPKYFQAMEADLKHFEYRKNDRNFKVGDLLVLCEWMPQRQVFTGRQIEVRVTLIVDDCPGLPEGYVIMETERVHAERIPL